jgi:hypothetical protein
VPVLDEAGFAAVLETGELPHDVTGGYDTLKVQSNCWAWSLVSVSFQ